MVFRLGIASEDWLPLFESTKRRRKERKMDMGETNWRKRTWTGLTTFHHRGDNQSGTKQKGIKEKNKHLLYSAPCLLLGEQVTTEKKENNGLDI